MNSNSENVTTSFFWKLLERGATQVLSLVIQILLARIISIDEFGIISILLVFVNFANVFVQKGFSSALIRKKTVDSKDYDTAFVVSEIIAILLCIIIIIIAPVVEDYYSINGISMGLRILSFSLVFGALYSIQNAYLVRNMRFRSIFLRSFIATVISGIIGIILAKKGFGFYSIVVQTLSQQVFLCLISFFSVHWKPKIRFYLDSFKNLFSFGSKVLLIELIASIIDDLRTLFIGKKYNTNDLAFYDRGQVYPATIMRCIYDSISSVMLPVFSKNHNNGNDISEPIQHTIIISLFWSCPIFIGLIAVSKQFVLVFLTEKWMPCIPYLIVFCIYQLAFPVYGIVRQAFYSIGKSSIVLKLEIIKAALYFTSIIIGLQFSPFVISILSCISMFLSTAVYYGVSCKYFNYRHGLLIREASKILISIIVMFITVYWFNSLLIPEIVKLVLDIIIGAAVYFSLSYVFKSIPMYTIKRYIEMMKEKKHGSI